MTKYRNLPNQSKGILEDYAIRKNLATKEGTVEKIPVNPSDIANKEYVDAQISGENHWDAGGTVGNETLYPHVLTSKVGIGTTSPSGPLHVVGTASSIIETDDNNDVVLTLRRSEVPTRNMTFQPAMYDGSSIYQAINFNGVGGDNPRVEFLGGENYYFDGNVGIGTSSPTTDLEISGADPINFVNNVGGSVAQSRWGYDGGAKLFIGALENAWAGISGSATNDSFIRYDTGSLLFSAGSTPKVVFDSSGNVGIGTTSPSRQFEVAKTARFGASDGLNNEGTIEFTHIAGGARVWYLRSGIGGVADASMAIGENTNGDRFVIDSSGNVGIGDTSPAEKLDVTGNINLTGVLKIDDVQVLKEQQEHIADLKTDYTAGDLDTEAEIITAFNTTNAKINAILLMLETHGLVASS